MTEGTPTEAPAAAEVEEAPAETPTEVVEETPAEVVEEAPKPKRARRAKKEVQQPAQPIPAAAEITLDSAFWNSLVATNRRMREEERRDRYRNLLRL